MKDKITFGLVAIFFLFLSDISVAEPLVLAHYMPQISAGVSDSFAPLSPLPSLPGGQLALLPSEWLNDLGSPEQATKRDIMTAQAAGIDGFQVLVGPLHFPVSQYRPVTESLFKNVQKLGSKKPFKLGLEFWDDMSDPQNISKLGKAITLLERYESAWLKMDNRKVLSIMITGAPGSKVLAFDEVMKLLLGDRRHQFYVVLYNPCTLIKNRPDWYRGADAFSLWINSDLARTLVEKKAAEKCALDSGKQFWAPIMPAFSQSRPGVKPNVREKLGMTNFVLDWKEAIQSHSPVAYEETWNDLTEDSSVMPESNHGFAYFDLNRWYSYLFHTGHESPASEEALYVFHHPNVVKNLQLPPGREPVPPLNGYAATPTTDYIGVVGRFHKEAEVTVEYFNGSQQIKFTQHFKPGMTPWLIYYPDPSRLNSFYPKEADGFVLTKLDSPLTDTEVYLSVFRSKSRIAFFRSHRPILGAAGRGDMSTIGDSFFITEKASAPKSKR